MSELVRATLGQRWVAIPTNLLALMERAGLDDPTIALNVAAWAYCFDQLTDGILGV
jgi:hypothetical protein